TNNHSSLIQHACVFSRQSYLFFQGYVDHRDLHSFPTRRSSDLHAQPLQDGGGLPTVAHGLAHRPRRQRRSLLQKADAHALASSRSEEHTSELQSPYDLVCRLLLEKKKKESDNTDK